MEKININKSLTAIQKAFDMADVPIRLVGGCVRDMMSGKDPKDFDMATPALPDEIKQILEKSNIKSFDLSNGHGTITAMIDNEGYEITTLRHDLETDGRHATVGFTTSWEEDSLRRDFTFNSMSMDFNGILYDYHGGMDDLVTSRVKFVGVADERIKEDYLRILRYFRFLGRMEKPEADYKTLECIKNNSTGLKKISGERIWMEIQKILAGNYTQFLIELMYAAQVSENIDVTFENRPLPASNDPITILAGLIGSSSAKPTIERWKLGGKEQKQLKWLVKFKDSNLNVSQLKSLVLNGVEKEFVMELMKIQLREQDFQTIKIWVPEEFPINGNDLIERGIDPGPEMGKLLNKLKQQWIDSNCQITKEQLLAKI